MKDCACPGNAWHRCAGPPVRCHGGHVGELAHLCSRGRWWLSESGFLELVESGTESSRRRRWWLEREQSG